LDALYSMARRLCRSSSEAEELVQEACLKAWESFGQLSSERKARAWLLSILHNAFIDRQRRDKRRPHIVDETLEEAMSHTDRFRAEAPAEMSLELGEAFAALEEEFRVVVWLADAEGFTVFEISRILGIPQGTVASRLFRGRNRLRQMLRS
jgi:RNA polymerase sigma-70 factor (ECF subfamily)